MTVSIYRKHLLLNTYFEEDKPQITFENVQNIEIEKQHIYGSIDGEQLTIKFDHANYNYYISS